MHARTVITIGLQNGPDLAVTRALLARGFRVVLVGSECARLEAVVDAVERQTPRADLLVSRVNVQNRQAVRSMVEHLRNELAAVHFHYDMDALPVSLQSVVAQGLVVPRVNVFDRVGKVVMAVAAAAAELAPACAGAIVMSCSPGARPWRTENESRAAARTWLDGAVVAAAGARRYPIPVSGLMHERSDDGDAAISAALVAITRSPAGTAVRG